MRIASRKSRIRPETWILVPTLVSIFGCSKFEADPWKLNPPRIVRGQEIVPYSADDKVNLSDELEILGNDGGAVPSFQITSTCQVNGEELRDEATFTGLTRLPMRRVLPLSALGKRADSAVCKFTINGRNSKGSTHSAELLPLKLEWPGQSNMSLGVNGQAMGGVLVSFINGNWRAFKLLGFPANAQAQLVCSRFRTKPVDIVENDPLPLFQFTSETIERNEFGAADPTLMATRQACRVVAHSDSDPTNRWYTNRFDVEFNRPQVDLDWRWTKDVFEQLNLNTRIGALTISNRSSVEVAIQLPEARDLMSMTPMISAAAVTFKLIPMHYAGSWKLGGQTVAGTISIPANSHLSLELETFHRCTFIRSMSQRVAATEMPVVLDAFRWRAKEGAIVALAVDSRNPGGENVLLAPFDAILNPVRDYRFRLPFNPDLEAPPGVIDAPYAVLDADIRKCEGTPFGPGD